MENVNTERDIYTGESQNNDMEFYTVSSAKVAIKFPLLKEDCLQEEQSSTIEETMENELRLDDEAESGKAEPDEKNITAGSTDELVFHGVVRDENNEVLEGAAVILFALYRGGQEKPLGYALTGSGGEYVINIPGKIDYDDLDGFKARAGKAIGEPAKSTEPARDKKRPDLNNRKNDFNSFLKFLLQR
ncbi:MAG: carboxypeptidase-like regulatory domain-containing protein [Bacillota bacterium]